MTAKELRMILEETHYRATIGTTAATNPFVIIGDQLLCCILR